MARGFDSLSPPFLSPRRSTGGGHVIDACTHVHKVHLCEHQGKSRDDVNDPAVGFQSRLFLSLSLLRSRSLFRIVLAVITNQCITPSCNSAFSFLSFCFFLFPLNQFHTSRPANQLLPLTAYLYSLVRYFSLFLLVYGLRNPFFHSLFRHDSVQEFRE